MKTIQIKDYVPLLPANAIKTSDVPKLVALIKELYNFTLKGDPKFHFFFEPEIIIRLDSLECINKVKEFLDSRTIKFEEYDYPFPGGDRFGESRDSIVAKNLDLFISVFHNNSVAALTLEGKDHFDYLERLMHTALNQKFYSLQQEGEYLKKLAELKLGKELV